MYFIPASNLTPFSPIIATGNAATLNITIDTGDSLSFSGISKTLEVKGNWINNCTFTPAQNKVLFSDSTAQTIAGSTNSFYDLEVNTTAGVTALANLTITNILALTSANTIEYKGSAHKRLVAASLHCRYIILPTTILMAR